MVVPPDEGTHACDTPPVSVYVGLCGHHVARKELAPQGAAGVFALQWGSQCRAHPRTPQDETPAQRGLSLGFFLPS